MRGGFGLSIGIYELDPSVVAVRARCRPGDRLRNPRWSRAARRLWADTIAELSPPVNEAPAWSGKSGVRRVGPAPPAWPLIGAHQRTTKSSATCRLKSCSRSFGLVTRFLPAPQAPRQRRRSPEQGSASPWTGETREMYLDNPHYVCTTVTGMATTSPAVRDDRQTAGDPLAELVLGWLAGKRSIDTRRAYCRDIAVGRSTGRLPPRRALPVPRGAGAFRRSPLLAARRS